VNEEDIRSEVRRYYARAAQLGSDGHGHDGVWGASRYDTDTLVNAPPGAVELSMGCGNPLTTSAIDEAPSHSGATHAQIWRGPETSAHVS